MAKTQADTLGIKKAELNRLYVDRAITKRTDLDERITALKEYIDQSEYGTFNTTLTNRKSLSYKDLLSLKNIKYKNS